MKKRSASLATGILAITALLLPRWLGAQEAISVEGESCQQHSMQGHSWYDSVVRENLSAGGWLSHFAGGGSPQATFSIDAPKTADYHFWIRCNPVQTALSYRWDRGEWQAVDLASAIEQVNVAADSKPDLRFIAWVNVGQVALSQGRHTLEFRFESRNNSHGAIDCFVLYRALRRSPARPVAAPGICAQERRHLYTSEFLFSTVDDRRR
jgi:hypothetical protein